MGGSLTSSRLSAGSVPSLHAAACSAPGRTTRFTSTLSPGRRRRKRSGRSSATPSARATKPRWPSGLWWPLPSAGSTARTALPTSTQTSRRSRTQCAPLAYCSSAPRTARDDCLSALVWAPERSPGTVRRERTLVPASHTPGLAHLLSDLDDRGGRAGHERHPQRDAVRIKPQMSERAQPTSLRLEPAAAAQRRRRSRQNQVRPPVRVRRRTNRRRGVVESLSILRPSAPPDCCRGSWRTDRRRGVRTVPCRCRRR